MRARFPLLLLIAATPTQAQLCNGNSIPLQPDGRALGHLPYGDAAPGSLVTVPTDLAINTCRLRPEAAADLQRLIAAAAGDRAVEGRLYAFSCHRSLAYQQSTFCRTRQSDSGADRAISAAPPGHSEHATGYVVDFGAPGPDGCNDLDPCMSGTPGGLWLMRNAPRFGFELSFPSRNAQGVTWEPWHWRWVGATAADPGAAAARAVFARARREFPGNPRVADPPPAPVRLKPVDPARFVGPRD